MAVVVGAVLAAHPVLFPPRMTVFMLVPVAVMGGAGVATSCDAALGRLLPSSRSQSVAAVAAVASATGAFAWWAARPGVFEWFARETGWAPGTSAPVVAAQPDIRKVLRFNRWPSLRDAALGAWSLEGRAVGEQCPKDEGPAASVALPGETER